MPRNGAMTSRRSRARTIVLLGLVLLTLLDTVGGIPYKRSLLRLCSKSLSDALYLACKGRGYNEPFSYSGEDDSQDSVGPGLAEECCYHQCSYSQLEQYCKPDKSSTADVEWVDVSFSILFFCYYFSHHPLPYDQPFRACGLARTASGTTSCAFIVDHSW